MKRQFFSEFEGTLPITLESGIKYVQVFNKDNVLMSDASQESFSGNVVYLYSENYSTNDFPLSIVMFSDSDISGGIALFGQSLSTPSQSARAAIGTRHQTAKNINVIDLANYINDGGSLYVNNKLEDISYSSARNNLDLYSKQEVRNFAAGVVTTDKFSGQSRNFTFAPYVSDNIWHHTGEWNYPTAKFNYRFENSIMYFSVTMNVYGFNIMNDGGLVVSDDNGLHAVKICSIQEAFSQPLAPDQPIILQPQVSRLPISGTYWDSTTDEEGDSREIITPFKLPLMVINSAPYSFRKGTGVAQAAQMNSSNSIYLVHPQVERGTRWVSNYGAWRRWSFDSAVQVTYRGSYAINDPQLT